MKCDEVRLESLLPSPDDGEGVETAARHLIECPDCRERLRVMVCLTALGRRRKSRSPSWHAKRWLAAAAVVLSLGLAALLSPPDIDPVADAPALNRPYARFPLATRSRPLAPSPRDRAFDAYRRADYEEASRLFRSLTPDPEAGFFLGVSLCLSGKPEEALTALRTAQEDERWRRPSLWYQANALLALDRPREAAPLLGELAGTEGEFRTQAERMLADPLFRSGQKKEPR